MKCSLLEKIFTGQAGGPTGRFLMMITEYLETKMGSITFEERDNEWLVGVPKIIAGTVGQVIGKDGKSPVTVQNTKYWAGSDVLVPKSTTSHDQNWGEAGICRVKVQSTQYLIGLDSNTIENKNIEENRNNADNN